MKNEINEEVCRFERRKGEKNQMWFFSVGFRGKNYKKMTNLGFSTVDHENFHLLSDFCGKLAVFHQHAANLRQIQHGVQSDALLREIDGACGLPVQQPPPRPSRPSPRRADPSRFRGSSPRWCKRRRWWCSDARGRRCLPPTSSFRKTLAPCDASPSECWCHRPRESRETEQHMEPKIRKISR